MYQIAIVDDEREAADNLTDCLTTYTQETGDTFKVKYFKNGLDFLDNYKKGFDVVFMDIGMPHLNGLDTARMLRKSDPYVVLVFVTNLPKYAINGYSVDAFDYILKPLTYDSFKPKIARALRYRVRSEKKELVLPIIKGYVRLRVDDIDYIEVFDHYRYYHTSQGVFKAYGTIQEIECLLPEKQFYKCSRSCLINLKNVIKIEGDCVFIGDGKLSISLARKKELIRLLTEGCF